MPNDVSAPEALANALLVEARGKISPDSYTVLETFFAVSLHIMRNVHPKHIREAVRLVEIQARIKGRPVV